MTRRFLQGFVLALGVGIAATVTVRARQTPAPANDPLPALLTEVRALRIAMERSAMIAPRIQIAMSRLQFEEQRVAQLSAQVDRTRQDLSRAVLEQQKLVDSLAEIEKQLTIETDPPRRSAMQSEQGDIKRRLKEFARTEAEMRMRESEATQALTTEQGRWTDLNARLDELERLLGPVR